VDIAAGRKFVEEVVADVPRRRVHRAAARSGLR
jgi:hypothetical protein